MKQPKINAAIIRPNEATEVYVVVERRVGGDWDDEDTLHLFATKKAADAAARVVNKTDDFSASVVPLKFVMDLDKWKRDAAEYYRGPAEADEG